MTHNFRKLTVSFMALAAAGHLWAADYSRFNVTGNSRIADSIVLGTAGLVQGQTVSAGELNAALQRLYQSGLFKDVSIATNGGTATINVVENSTISGVFFEGNKKIKDEQLASVISIQTRDGLDEGKVEEDVQAIRRVYAARSRFDVDIKPVIIPSGNGTYKVVFEINEGTVSEIERVSFTGNQSVSDWQLRRVVDSSEAGVFSSLFSRDNFATEKLGSDAENILDYYRENGFYSAQIRASQADYDAGGNFYLSYAINEGRRYDFGDITFEAEALGVDAAKYAGMAEMRSGKVYQASKIRNTIEAIERQAQRDGLPFLRAQPVITTNEENGTVNVVFRLTNAERVYVERIDIRGNDATIDRVIRREFESVEGDPLNARKINEARQNIERLGFFSEVSVQTREGSTPDQKIIDVDVTEAPTGKVTFGGSYSTSDSWSVFASVNERNFLGRGQTVAFKIDYGAQSQTARLSFTEPSLFDRDLSGGFDLYYGRADNEAAVYQTTNLGFEPRISFPVSDNSRLSLGYFLRQNEIRDSNDTTSPLIVADEGTLLTSGVSATWSWDRTDSFVDPSRGWIVRLGGKYAGLGGDAKWGQLGVKAKVFYPLLRDQVRFTAEIEGGMIETFNDEAIRVNERYFMGGSSSLNGFKSGGIGPRDVSGDVNSALGGNYYASARAQLRFPIGIPEELGITGGVFWDVGSVWGLDNTTGGASGTIDDGRYWRASRGVALYWDLGGQQLAFNFSDPYQKQDYDKTEEFSVSIVTKF